MNHIDPILPGCRYLTVSGDVAEVIGFTYSRMTIHGTINGKPYVWRLTGSHYVTKRLPTDIKRPLVKV